MFDPKALTRVSELVWTQKVSRISLLPLLLVQHSNQVDGNAVKLL